MSKLKKQIRKIKKEVSWIEHNTDVIKGQNLIIILLLSAIACFLFSISVKI